MTRRLMLDPDAERDLDAIFRYIAQRNPPAAERYIRELRERCQFYAESPFMGQAEPSIARRLGLPSEQVRSFLYRNHRCYYAVTDEEMRVFGFIEQFAAVLAEEPDDAEAIHWLLCAGTALERWEALADHLLAYLRLTPGDLAVRFALIGLYVRLADWEAARQEYETLRLLQPTFEGLEELALAIDQGEPAAAQHTGGVAHPSVAS